MSLDPRIFDILMRYEELLSQGQAATLAELCRDCPEILEDARQCLQGLKGLAPLASTVPGKRASGPEDSTKNGDALPPLVTDASLPQVPGYELVSLLGRGGMGAVYSARDASLERILAVKVLLSEHADDDDLRQRFLEEARIMGQLQHPGVAPLHEMGKLPDGRPFFTMKQIKGRTFAALLAERQSPAENLPQLVGIFTQVCQTLAYAHERHIIHRDLKPDNVMVGAFGEVQVMDWGLAKLLQKTPAGSPQTQTKSGPERTVIHSPRSDLPEGHATASGSVIGTVAYMPPEQAIGKVELVDERSDVFGLGAILCQILTGQPPYSAGNSAERHMQACRADQRAALENLQKCQADAELKELCRRCLEPERQQRPAHAGELAEALTKYQAGVEQRLRDAEIAQVKAAEERKRRRVNLALGAMALVAVLLVGVGAVMWSLWNDTDAARQEAEEAKADLVLANADLEEAHAKTRQAMDRALQAEKLESLATKETFNRFLYFERVSSFARISRDGYGALTSNLLNSCDEKYRSFEWYYLQNFVVPEDATLTGHKGDVLNVTYSPDGNRLASASEDGTVKLWDAPTGKEIATLAGHEGFDDVRYSPDGLRLAKGGSNGIVKLWDAQTGKEIATLAGHKAAITGAAFSPDGQRLASASKDGMVKLWDTHTGKEVVNLTGHTVMIFQVAYSPDGKLLASADDDGMVKVWDAKSAQEIATLKGHKLGVCCLAFSPDGHRLASASKDGTIKLWDPQTGKEVATLKGHSHWVTHVTYSPDGRHLASASFDKTVKLWDADTGKEVRTLEGHKGEVIHLTYNPAGNRLASASVDKTVKVWSTRVGIEVATLAGHRNHVVNVTYSPDGQRLASASTDGTVKLWEAQTRKEVTLLAGHKGPVTNLAYSPDGQRLASISFDEKIKLWDTQTGKQLATLPGHPDTVAPKDKSGLAWVMFSSDGQRLASSAMWDKSVKLWDPKTFKELASLEGHTDSVNHVTFSPDDRQLASASEDKTVKLWNASTGKEMATLHGHSDAVLYVAYSPDGRRLASASKDEKVKLWDTQTGKEVPNSPGHTGVILKVAYSPDGKLLASASGDKSVKLWDAATGKGLRTLPGHAGAVVNISFSPDNRHLASASGDGTVRLWDAQTGQGLATLDGHKGIVYRVTYSPDGKRLASASEDKTVRLWDAKTGKELCTFEGHNDLVFHLTFRPDGQQLASASYDGTVRLWNGKVDEAAWEKRKHFLREQEAESAYNNRQWFAAAFLHEKLVGQDPDNVSVLFHLGWANAQLKRWDKAEVAFTAATAKEPKQKTYWPRYCLGLVMLGKNQIEEYRRLSRELLAEFAETPGHLQVAWLALLTKDAAGSQPALVKLATKSVEENPKFAEARLALGAAYYRGANFDKALEELNTAVELQQKTDQGTLPWMQLFLAMTHHQLGHSDQAKLWLDKAIEQTQPKNWNWNDSFCVEFLRREAEALIRGKE